MSAHETKGEEESKGAAPAAAAAGAGVGTTAAAHAGASGKPKRVLPTVTIARKTDLVAYSRLQAQAFREKMAHVGMNEDKATELTRFTTEPSWEEWRAVCGVVRGDEDEILGVCQLQFQGQTMDEPDNVVSGMCSLLGCFGCCRVMKFAVIEGHKCKSGECYIAWIGVAEGQRGKGIGKALMQWADATALERHCTHMTLGVMTTNRAMALYERVGYVTTSTTPKCCCCCLRCLIGYPGVAMMRKELV